MYISIKIIDDLNTSHADAHICIYTRTRMRKSYSHKEGILWQLPCINELGRSVQNSNTHLSVHGLYKEHTHTHTLTSFRFHEDKSLFLKISYIVVVFHRKYQWCRLAKNSLEGSMRISPADIILVIPLRSSFLGSRTRMILVGNRSLLGTKTGGRPPRRTSEELTPFCLNRD